MVLLAGKNPQQQASYSMQYEAISNIFARAGIGSAQKTHAMRGCGAHAAELHGVSESQVGISLILSFYANLLNYLQIRRAGRWDTTVMSNVYLTGLPVKFLRKVAGFPASGRGYFIP